jgi:hypothetical protein
LREIVIDKTRVRAVRKLQAEQTKCHWCINESG